MRLIHAHTHTKGARIHPLHTHTSVSHTHSLDTNLTHTHSRVLHRYNSHTPARIRSSPSLTPHTHPLLFRALPHSHKLPYTHTSLPHTHLARIPYTDTHTHAARTPQTHTHLFVSCRLKQINLETHAHPMLLFCPLLCETGSEICLSSCHRDCLAQ